VLKEQGMYIEIHFMNRRREQLHEDLFGLKNQVPREMWSRTDALVDRVEELLKDALDFCRVLNDEIEQLKEEQAEAQCNAEMAEARLTHRCRELDERALAMESERDHYRKQATESHPGRRGGLNF
jgi:FtsZ-binding cell division protein ZapB